MDGGTETLEELMCSRVDQGLLALAGVEGKTATRCGGPRKQSRQRKRRTANWRVDYERHGPQHEFFVQTKDI